MHPNSPRCGKSSVIESAADDLPASSVPPPLTPSRHKPGEIPQRSNLLILDNSSLKSLAYPLTDPHPFDSRFHAPYLKWSKPGTQVTLLGAAHMSFTDMAVIKAFELPGDGKAFIDSTRAVIGGFFGQYLLGEHSELIEKGSAKYPLAKVETPR